MLRLSSCDRLRVVLLTLQASVEDHRDGPGPVTADLRDGGQLSVLGERRCGDPDAAELPELRPAAPHLHDHPQHTQRWL